MDTDPTADESSELLLSRDEVRTLDRLAIESYGVPSLVLMENAGRACADVVRARLGSSGRGSVLVVCGRGNNAGDGLVVARTLVNHGIAVAVAFAGAQDDLTGGSPDFMRQRQMWEQAGGAIVALAASPSWFEEQLREAAWVVDALYGTGLRGEVRPPVAGWMRAIDASPAAVLAVDVPSGLDADTGAVLGQAIRAEETVTFVARKRGLCVGEGPRLAGRVTVAEIGIPRLLLDRLSG